MLTVLELIGWMMEIGAILMLIWLAITLFIEREMKRLPRALIPGILLIASFAAVLAGDFPHRTVMLSISELLVLGIGLLFFLPIGKLEKMVIPLEIPRFDERDIMFARAGYREGKANYRDYYDRHPEKRKPDDHIRTLPGLCSPGASTYEPISARIARSGFQFLEHIRPLAEGAFAPEKQATSPGQITTTLKGLAKYHGAKIVGVTETRPYHYYSYRGRSPDNYGDEIIHTHKFAIVFAVEMDYWMVKTAPLAPVVIESCKEYIEAAKIGMVLAYFIRQLGFDARNHMDGNYLVCAPLVAHDAGIGELSRMGTIITQDYGPRVRLGVVTTDLPLVADEPIVFGVQDSCQACKKCAQTCPSQAIPHGDKSLHDGVLKWKISQEKCYEFWCKVGTDCAICMNTCPYSKPNTLIHRLYRLSLQQSSLSRRIMVHFDDYLYGRRPSTSQKPDWM
ncbi:MAG: reductive dehalogenase [Sporomusaceae bacterium]|nr:reductive dehalogenase [Sporomusaceae bacterium]